METGYCKYCGEPIYWLRTPKGRMMPVDTIPYTIVPQRNAAGKYVTKEGKVISGLRGVPGSEGTLIGYTPHFGSCRQYRK